MARAVLRATVAKAAQQAHDEAGFFARLQEAGVLLRLRYSETTPGEVTGYAVALPGHSGQDGEPRWYGGGRLASGLTLPQLRRRWDGQSAAPRSGPGAFGFTAPERDAFCRHAARQAEAAADQIRRSAGGDLTAAADTAWAAAAAFHATARAIRDPALRRAADTFDRAARAAYGKIPYRTTEGDRLRAAARLLAMAGGSRPAPRRPRFTWRRASSGWPGRSASCARRSSTRRKQQQQGRRPKACTPRSAGRGRAPPRWASLPRRGRPRPSASPEMQRGLTFQSRSSRSHSHRTAAVTPPRSHLRGQDLPGALPRVRSGPVSRPRTVTIRLTERRPPGARGHGSGASRRPT